MLETIFLLISDKQSSDIRSTSVLSIEKLFHAYLHHYHLQSLSGNVIELKSNLTEVMTQILMTLFECLKNEVNNTCRSELSATIKDVLSLCYFSGKEISLEITNRILSEEQSSNLISGE